MQGNKPKGILGDGDPEELAQVVEHAHGGGACPPLQEGRYHVEQHKGIEHLHAVCCVYVRCVSGVCDALL